MKNQCSEISSSPIERKSLKLPFLKTISATNGAIFLLIIFSLFFISLQLETKNEINSDLKINLKWYKSYESQSWENVRTGMLWSFSQMGAMLPKNSFDSALTFKDSTLFTLDLKKIGFNSKAEEALTVICDSIIKTKEYQINQHIDIARFFLLTLHAPFNYYKIVDAIPIYSEFVKQYQLNEANVFGVTQSTVCKENRLIKFSKDSTLFNFVFVAEEGQGSLIEGTFKTQFYEAIDIMPNGQFRYAIYNLEGKLIDASLNPNSGTGKPSKCMWCHEQYIQPLFRENIAVENMMSNEEFVVSVKRLQRILDSYRRTLNSDIDFGKKQDHTQSELLYISFMEPSLYRLEIEFGSDRSAIDKIKKMSTHLYHEFTFLGNLYYRNQIDSVFSYPKIKISTSVREKNEFEPNYFN